MLLWIYYDQPIQIYANVSDQVEIKPRNVKQFNFHFIVLFLTKMVVVSHESRLKRQMKYFFGKINTKSNYDHSTPSFSGWEKEPAFG